MKYRRRETAPDWRSRKLSEVEIVRFQHRLELLLDARGKAKTVPVHIQEFRDLLEARAIKR